MELKKGSVNVAVFSESPLAMVVNVLLSNNFAEINETVTENEKIIGEFTSLEKALYTAKNQIADSHNAAVEDAIKNGGKFDKLTIEKNKVNFEAIDALFWASIQNRIGEPAFKNDGIGVRNGYKIVQTKPISQGLDFLQALFGGDKHNCDECPDYDECNLPVKKVRKQ